MSGGDLLDRVDMAEVVAAFGRLLHAAGVPATPERSGRFAAALALVRPGRLDELYWAGRVTLLTAWADIDAYDRVFGHVFRGLADVADWRGQAPPPAPPRPPATGIEASTADAPPPPAGNGGTESPSPAAADADADDHVPGSPPSSADHEPDLLAAPPRDSRRRVRHPRGDRVDLRATLRRARATGGDPVVRVLRRRTERPRRLVLIADVSGSMAPYARAYLHLLHGAVRATRADAFVFATRLTRLTRQLAFHDPDVALARALAAAPDWAGGTRMGDALKAFMDDHGRRGMARGAVVVIVSDGWDTGDPAVVAEQMARLSRLAHRIVWVNPRKAAEGYEPLVAGMAAALPHVDVFLSGHSARALDDVIAAIAAPAAVA